MVYIWSQLHAVPLKVAVFKNNQTFYIKNYDAANQKTSEHILQGNLSYWISEVNFLWSIVKLGSFHRHKRFTLCGLFSSLAAFFSTKKTSSYLKFSSYPCDPALSKPANVILNCPYCGHNVSHTQTEILLPWLLEDSSNKVKWQIIWIVRQRKKRKKVLFLQLKNGLWVLRQCISLNITKIIMFYRVGERQLENNGDFKVGIRQVTRI